MVDADAHPADVAGDIVDAIGRRPAEFGDDKIMHANFLGRALRPPFASGVLEVADQFLLLGIDRYRRLTRRKRFFHPIVDVAELRIAIGMVRSFTGLAVGLQSGNRACAGVRRPACGRSVWPMSRRLWLSLRRLLHVHSSGDCGSPRVSGSTSERRSSSKLASVSLAGLQPPPGRRTRSASGLLAHTQFGQSTSDRAARDPGGAHHRNDPAMPGRRRLGGRKTPPTALVEYRGKRLEALAYGRFVNHASTI